jgi:uncharacterized membrane protein YfcA
VYALSLTEWLFTGLAAVLIGFVKTGLPGVGLIIVIIMAAVFPAKESTGILLPMLIFADIFAVTFYRHHARWKILLRLFPPAIAGIISGFFFMGEITSKQLKPVMGIIILAMLLAVVLMKWKNVTFKNINIPFAVFMDVEKKDFVGSRAWFFAGLNLVKIPFSAGLGLITVESLIFDAKLFPAILAGALGGYFLVNVIPQKLFNYVVQVLAAASAIYIIISSF